MMISSFCAMLMMPCTQPSRNKKAGSPWVRTPDMGVVGHGYCFTTSHKPESGFAFAS